MPIVEKVRNALAAAGVRPGDPVVVGCSHGPDSLALAEIARELVTTTLVYVDHGLRAAAADEARSVEAYARDRGLSARVVRVEVRPDGTGVEDAARRARHAALEQVADELGARWILLGHHAGDQAETVLLRLLRGAGPVGLAGIAPARGRIVHPFLDVSRAEIDDFLATRGLAPSRDESNDSDAYARNRIRRALAAENPRLEETLGRTARAMRELAGALDWIAEREDTDDAARLRALPPAVAKRIFQRRRPELEARHLDALLALLDHPGSTSLDLPGGSVHLEYGRLRFGAAGPTPAITVDGPDAPYAIRSWRPGDRIRLRGGSRKLSDAWTDRKIPRAARHAARLVVRERDGEIVWAEHVGPAWMAEVRVALTASHTTAINDDG